MSRIAIIGCGSRAYANVGRIDSDLMELYLRSTELWIIEGGAPGADAIVGNWARGMHHHTRYMEDHRVRWIPMVANWAVGKNRAGPQRNHEMLMKLKSLSVDERMVYAYPLGDSKGTANMMEAASRAHVTVHIRTPNWTQ